MSNPPHPPDESADDVRAMLRAHHPELSDVEIDALLTGEPKRRRKGYRPNDRWYEGKRGPHGGGSVVPGRLGRRIRLGRGRR